MIVINPANQKGFFGLVEMTCRLVDASHSLPEWQAAKLTFFVSCKWGLHIEYFIGSMCVRYLHRSC